MLNLVGDSLSLFGPLSCELMLLLNKSFASDLVLTSGDFSECSDSLPFSCSELTERPLQLIIRCEFIATFLFVKFSLYLASSTLTCERECVLCVWLLLVLADAAESSGDIARNCDCLNIEWRHFHVYLPQHLSTENGTKGAIIS
jgi:hypothetical protein